jgi:hypothetical protein
MKKILKSLFIIAMLIGVIQFSSHAQLVTPGINAKQLRQESKIRQGVKSGELTRRETKGLILEQKQVKLMKRAAKADGKVTRRERKVLRNKQRSADYHIYRQKHDGQSRY